ncbi:MAG TPA: diguanylate cyclase, partial [Croceibacterium sp.]|nr:diguanylate cyclase [Croceibacterium sp.]
MLRNLGAIGAGSTRASAPQSGIDEAERLAMLEAFEEDEIGWFWATDSENRLIYLSGSALRRFGTERPVLGQPLVGLVESASDEGEERTERPLSFLLSARNRFTDFTVRVETVDGEMFWSLTGKPSFDANERFQGYRGSAKDISANVERQRDASRLAQFDSLTGLANRHRMATRLATNLTAFRAAKRSCALLMLDLDRFKQVNDTLGHPAGDDLLKQVAQRLERIVSAPAEIGRLGGDEFEVIIPDVDDRGQLGELAQRIIQMISQPYSIDGMRAIIGTSVGIAIAPYDGIEPDELVKAADLALYAAKGGGRGQYRFYSNDLKDSAHERREIEEDLRDALTRGELTMHYQPVVRAADNMVSGFEA